MNIANYMMGICSMVSFGLFSAYTVLYNFTGPTLLMGFNAILSGGIVLGLLLISK